MSNEMKVLIAVEDDTSGETIVKFAIENMASPHNSTEYVVLHVIPPLSTYLQHALTPELAAKLSSNARKEGKLLVREMAQKLRSATNATTVKEVVAEGHIIEEILSMAGQWGTQLILVGTDERKGIGQCFPCSVSMAVLSHSDCSVLVVRNARSATEIGTSKYSKLGAAL